MKVRKKDRQKGRKKERKEKINGNYSTKLQRVFYLHQIIRQNFHAANMRRDKRWKLLYYNAGKPIGSCTDTKMNGELNRNHK